MWALWAAALLAAVQGPVGGAVGRPQARQGPQAAAPVNAPGGGVAPQGARVIRRCVAGSQLLPVSPCPCDLGEATVLAGDDFTQRARTGTSSAAESPSSGPTGRELVGATKRVGPTRFHVMAQAIESRYGPGSGRRAESLPTRGGSEAPLVAAELDYPGGGGAIERRERQRKEGPGRALALTRHPPWAAPSLAPWRVGAPSVGGNSAHRCRCGWSWRPSGRGPRRPR